MKRIIALAVIVLLLFGLFGCGGNKDDSTRKESSIKEPATESTEDDEQVDDVPSDEIIANDLKYALSIENEFAAITETSVVKSFTEDSYYSVTLTVNASTKYADWKYEADMSYTRYDQGWMVDGVEWVSDSYELVRIPDVDVMVDYAEEYLPNHETYSDVWFTGYMVPMRSPSINFGMNNEVDANVLELSWVGEEYLKHAIREHTFNSLWQYDPEIDNWTLYPDNSHGSLGYYLSDTEGDLFPNYQLDFTGQWKSIRMSNAELTVEFDISNFTWEAFDSAITWVDYDYIHREPAGTKERAGHFVRIDQSEVPDELAFNLYGAHCVFSDNHGGYISFEFSLHRTRIQYVAYGDGVVDLTIDRELPAL